METLKLNDVSLVELSNDELVKIDGGLPVATLFWALVWLGLIIIG